METLKWIFQLYDGVSGPAKDIEKALGGVEKKLFTIDKQGRKRGLDGKFLEMGGLEKMLKDLPGDIEKVHLGFQALIGGAQALAGVVFDSGRFAVNALAFKESTLASFELMLGTKEEAKGLFDIAKTFGKLTPFETQDVIKSFKDLLQAGFKREEVPILFQAVGDVAAGNNFDKSIMDRLTLVLGQIRGNGRINGGDFIQLTNAGVGRSPVYEAIAKMMGVKSTDVAKLVEQGKVTSDIAIAAVLDSIKAKFSGGKELGQGMLSQATTLKGLFSTLASAPMDMFLDIDLENSPGFKGLKSFVTNLVEALSPDGVNGSKLKAVIEGVVNDVGGMLSRMTPEVLTEGFDKFVSLVKTGVAGIAAFKDSVMTILGPTFELMTLMSGGQERSEGFINAMKVLGYLLGGILNVVMLLGMGIGKAFEGFKALGDIDWSYLLEQMKSFGADLLMGLADGILNAINHPVDAIMSAGRATIDAFKSILDIHSPSGVFEELGAFTAQGFADGVTAARGEVDSAVGNMVQIPSLSGGGKAAPIVNLTVQVDGAGADAETLARKLADLLPSQLASAFEQLAIEGGAA